MRAAFLRWRWPLLHWLSRLILRLAPYVPTQFAYAVAHLLAGLFYVLMTEHRRNLVTNLAHVVGPREAPGAARRVFFNFGRYLIDFYQLGALGPAAIRERLQFEDWRRLDEALDAPNGVLFVTLHLGLMDLGAAAVAAHGHTVNVVAESLPDSAMNTFIQGLRKSMGVRVIAADKARMGVMRCLHRGEVLVMMLDAFETGQGRRVDFLGGTADFAGGPARIALRTGARILPAVIGRGGTTGQSLVPLVDFDLSFAASGDEEADIQHLTQALARSFEVFVRRFPEEWFAFKPLFAAPLEEPVERPAGLRQRSKEWALQGGILLGGLLPRPAAYAMARLGGDAAFVARRGARRDVEDNMRHIMGANAPPDAIRRAAREAFRNVARYYVDLIRVPRMKPDQLLQEVRLHDFERLKSRLDAGQSVVVATAHFGNPELAVQVGAVLGVNTLVLAEPLEPPAFARLMKRIRSTYAPRYEDVGFSGVAEAIRHLRAGGGCLAITCDRDLQGKGVPLPFFGAFAKLPLGAVELAVRTGAVLMPGYCRRSSNGFDIYFEEPVELVSTGRPKEDALANARSLLARVEPWLRSDPGQWMVLERIWKP
jgi:lauroyl/myristoyl acyltransferase